MSAATNQHLLEPGFALTLRPMRYPVFYEMYKDAIRNTWTVEEIDFGIDLNDLRHKLSAGDRHLIERLVAFFATGDSTTAVVSSRIRCNPHLCRFTEPSSGASRHLLPEGEGKSTSTRPRRACTCRGSCTRKHCTCSST